MQEANFFKAGIRYKFDFEFRLTSHGLLKTLSFSCAFFGGWVFFVYFFRGRLFCFLDFSQRARKQGSDWRHSEANLAEVRRRKHNPSPAATGAFQVDEVKK